MSGHTSLPWREWHGDIVAEGDEASDYDDYVIAGIGVSYGSRSSVYCPVRAHKPEGKANAAFIVRACNSHSDMLEALEGIKWQSCERDNMEFAARITYSQMDRIRAAIAKAKGDAS